eukprot:7315645-Prymnesium_polylepis.1
MAEEEVGVVALERGMAVAAPEVAEAAADRVEQAAVAAAAMGGVAVLAAAAAESTPWKARIPCTQPPCTCSRCTTLHNHL